jgi:hypothetical protein
MEVRNLVERLGTESRKQKAENRIHAMWQQAFKEEVEEDGSIVRQWIHPDS